MHIYHNSHLTDYRSHFGAAPVGISVTLSLDVTDISDNSFLKVYLDHSKDGSSFSLEMHVEKMHAENGYRYSAVLPVGDKPGVIWYLFRIEENGNALYYGNNADRLGGEGVIYNENPLPYQITVFKPDHVPEWYLNGIVYQIFPDRFNRSVNWQEHQKAADEAYIYGINDQKPGGSADTNYQAPAFLKKFKLYNNRPVRSTEPDWSVPPRYPRNDHGGVSNWIFSGGDLNGIVDKLAYLKELGISVLYLNPVFKASSNHKYDTADYLQIDEAFGCEEDFIRLCTEAKKLGIHIILDGVFNHTGCDSRYFDIYNRFGESGACQDQASKYYPWYTFTEDGYDSWWGVPDLPSVNEANESYQDFIYNSHDSVVRRWLRLGASGWRLDVADELPDEFIEGIRSAMLKEDPESLLMGEVWEDSSNKESYGKLRNYFSGYELQSTMNYPFRSAALNYFKGKTNAYTFSRLMLSLKENYPPSNFYAALNLIGSHDRIRILTELADGPDAIAERIANPFTIPSSAEQALIDQGISRTDAIKECWHIPEDKKWMAYNRLKAMSLMQFVMPGVPCIYYGDEAGMEGFEDPYCRGNFPWGHEDEELEAHFHFLCKLRNTHPTLISGSFDIYALSEHVVCIERSDADENIRLIVNRGIFEWEHVSITKGGVATQSTIEIDLLTGKPCTDDEIDLLTGKPCTDDEITLPPLGAMLLCKRSNHKKHESP